MPAPLSDLAPVEGASSAKQPLQDLAPVDTPAAAEQPSMTVGRAALGAAEIAGAKIASYPGQMIGAAENLVTGRTGAPPLQVEPGKAGQQLQQTVHAGLEKYVREPLRQALPGAYEADVALQRRQEQFMAEHPAVQRASDIAGDIATLSPLGVGAKAAGEWAVGGTESGLAKTLEQAATSWRQDGFASPAAAQADVVGFRTGEGHEIAGMAAGPAKRKILINNNADVGNVIAKHAAGVADSEPLSYATLKKGLEAPNAVYNRAYNALPTRPLSPANIDRVRAAAAEVDDATAARWVNKLTSKPLSPQDVQKHLSDLRSEGFANIGSRLGSERALGRAQLSMADALEDHIELNLPEGSGTSREQLRAARQAIAQNLTVQRALRGSNLDLAKLGRMYRAKRGQGFTGGLKVAAEFAEDNGAVVSQRIKGADTTLRETSEKAASGKILGAATGVARMTGIPQRALLRGGGADAARKLFPGRDDSAFAPLPPPPGANLGGRFRAATEGYTPPPRRPPPPPALTDMDSDLP